MPTDVDSGLRSEVTHASRLSQMSMKTTVVTIHSKGPPWLRRVVLLTYISFDNVCDVFPQIIFLRINLFRYQKNKHGGKVERERSK